MTSAAVDDEGLLITLILKKGSLLPPCTQVGMLYLTDPERCAHLIQGLIASGQLAEPEKGT